MHMDSSHKCPSYIIVAQLTVSADFNKKDFYHLSNFNQLAP